MVVVEAWLWTHVGTSSTLTAIIAPVSRLRPLYTEPKLPVPSSWPFFQRPGCTRSEAGASDPGIAGAICAGRTCAPGASGLPQPEPLSPGCSAGSSPPSSSDSAIDRVLCTPPRIVAGLAPLMLASVQSEGAEPKLAYCTSPSEESDWYLTSSLPDDTD